MEGQDRLRQYMQTFEDNLKKNCSHQAVAFNWLKDDEESSYASGFKDSDGYELRYEYGLGSRF